MTTSFDSLLVNRAGFPGEILALLGENGAGKSTLIKMLAGVHAPDEGGVRVQGAALAGSSKGSVSFIHQDLDLIEWKRSASWCRPNPPP